MVNKILDAAQGSYNTVTVMSGAFVGGVGYPAQWKIEPQSGSDTSWIKVQNSSGSTATIVSDTEANGFGRQTLSFTAKSKNSDTEPRVAIFDVTSKYYTGYSKQDTILITLSGSENRLLSTEYTNVRLFYGGSQVDNITVDSGSDVEVTIKWDVVEKWSNGSVTEKFKDLYTTYTFTNVTGSGTYTTNQTTYSYDNGYPNKQVKITVNTNNYSTEYSLVQEDIPTVAYNATTADIKYRVYWTNYNNGVAYGGQHRSSSLVTISNHSIGSANSGIIRNIRCDNGDNGGYADLSWEVNRESAPVTTYTIYDGVSNATMYINGTAVSGGSYGNIISGSSISGYFIALNNQFFEDSGDITASPSVVTFTKVNNSRIDFYISSVTSDISFGGGPSVTGSGELELQVSPTEVEFGNTGGTESVTISVVRSTITPSISDLYIVRKPDWITNATFSGSLSGTRGCTLNMTASNNYNDNVSTNPKTDVVIVGYNDYQDIQLNIAVSLKGHDAQGGNTGGEVTYITVANQVSNTDLSGVVNNQIPRGGQFSIIARNGYYFDEEISVDGGEAAFGGDDGDGHLTSYIITASSDTSVSRIIITGNVTPIQTTPVYYTITNTVPNTTIDSSSVSPGGNVTLSPDSGYYIYEDKITVNGSATVTAEYGSVVISNIQSDITISGYATELTTRRTKYTLSFVSSASNRASAYADGNAEYTKIPCPYSWQDIDNHDTVLESGDGVVYLKVEHGKNPSTEQRVITGDGEVTLTGGWKSLPKGITLYYKITLSAGTVSYSLSLSLDSINVTSFANSVNVADYISTNSPAGTELTYSLSGDSAFTIDGSTVSVLGNMTTSQRSCVVTVSQDVTNGKSAKLTITQDARTITPVTEDEYEIVLGTNEMSGTGSTTIQIKKNGSVISPNWSNVVIDQDPQGYAEAMLSDYGNTQRVITVTRCLGALLKPIESSFFIEYYVDGISVADTSLVIMWDTPEVL